MMPKIMTKLLHAGTYPFEYGEGCDLEADEIERILNTVRAHLKYHNLGWFLITDQVPDVFFRRQIIRDKTVFNDVWFVHLSYFPGEWVLCSTRIVCVSKKTGKVTFDGCAHDEG